MLGQHRESRPFNASAFKEAMGQKVVTFLLQILSEAVLLESPQPSTTKRFRRFRKARLNRCQNKNPQQIQFHVDFSESNGTCFVRD